MVGFESDEKIVMQTKQKKSNHDCPSIELKGFKESIAYRIWSAGK